MEKIIIKTKKKKEVVDITETIAAEVRQAGLKDGVLHLFLTHTTAALTTADLDPGGTDLDYLEALEKMVPKLNYRHPHQPSHMPDHILSSLIGSSLTLPVEEGRLALGTWQRVVLMEFDGPRERQIILKWSP